MKHWFSSDYHLGHKNILKYDSRPFKTIEEHDEHILAKQNELVGDDDHFYFLGDFCLDEKHAVRNIEKLKGKLFFIRGNHDNTRTIGMFQYYGTYLGDMYDFKLHNQYIVLCHYRMDVWNRSHHGSWNLHGHSHHNLGPSGKRTLDLGVNGWNYEPVEFNQIKELMDALPKNQHHSKDRG